MEKTKKDIYFYSSLFLAIWFALTACAWTYLMNLVISLPFGILSYVLWRAGKKTDIKINRYKAIPIIWAIGVVISLIVLIVLLIWN